MNGAHLWDDQFNGKRMSKFIDQKTNDQKIMMSEQTKILHLTRERTQKREMKNWVDLG